MFRIKTLQTVAAGIAVLMVPLVVSADVTVKQKTSSAIMGGVIKASGIITTSIRGDKERNETEMKTKVLLASPTVKTADIMRLDKEIVWNLDQKKQTYTEMTFAEMRALLDSANAQMQAVADESKKTKEEDQYEVSPPEFSVERTGNKATIAGYACDEVILKAVTRAKDKRTGDTSTFTLNDRIWVTKDFAGQAEFDAFYQKAAARLGFGRGMESAASSLGMMGIDAKALAKEMAMYTSGGPQQQVRKESGETEEESATPADKLKKLGGLFGKKKDKAKEEESKGAAPAPGALFSMTIEVESVSAGSIDAAQFEIPAGYKKVEKKK